MTDKIISFNIPHMPGKTLYCLAKAKYGNITLHGDMP